MKRLPNPGEVWTFGSQKEARTVVNVYPDAVTFRTGGSLNALVVDQFVGLYDPPEPTVLFDFHIKANEQGIDFEAAIRNCTHIVQVMSDGTVRLVEVDG